MEESTGNTKPMEESTEEKRSKRRSTKKKPSAETMSFENYARDNMKRASGYVIAYLQPKYRGRMKTKEEWDAELAPFTN